MSVAEPAPRLMTADEFLALPDDGRERWLVDGVVYTLEDSVTLRNRMHSAVTARITGLLHIWHTTQPSPRGMLHSGGIGFRLRRDPDQMVGADVAYVSAELVAATPEGLAFYDGAPAVAVEVLSPSDRHEDIVHKVRLYRDAGAVVWVVDAELQTVQVYLPDRSNLSFGNRDELTGDPYLPGFRVAMADLFET